MGSDTLPFFYLGLLERRWDDEPPFSLEASTRSFSPTLGRIRTGTALQLQSRLPNAPARIHPKSLLPHMHIRPPLPPAAAHPPAPWGEVSWSAQRARTSGRKIEAPGRRAADRRWARGRRRLSYNFYFLALEFRIFWFWKDTRHIDSFVSKKSQYN
jgi:hypothetical protein